LHDCIDLKVTKIQLFTLSQNVFRLKLQESQNLQASFFFDYSAKSMKKTDALAKIRDPDKPNPHPLLFG